MSNEEKPPGGDDKKFLDDLVAKKYDSFIAAGKKLKETLLSDEFMKLGSVEAVIILLRSYADELEFLQAELLVKRLKDIQKASTGATSSTTTSTADDLPETNVFTTQKKTEKN